MLRLVAPWGKGRFFFLCGIKNRSKFLAILFILSSWKWGFCTDVVQPSDVVSLVKKFYVELQSYQSGFRETKGTRIRNGVIKLQKPDKLLIQYFDGDGRIHFSILSTGSKMYIEIPYLQVIVEQDMTFSETENTFLQGVGLVGTADIFKEYDFNFETGNIGEYQMLATPKNMTVLGLYPMQMQVRFDGCIEKTILESSEGTKIAYDFFDIRKDVVYVEKDFEVQNADRFEVLRNILVDLSSL